MSDPTQQLAATHPEAHRSRPKKWLIAVVLLCVLASSHVVFRSRPDLPKPAGGMWVIVRGGASAEDAVFLPAEDAQAVWRVLRSARAAWTEEKGVGTMSLQYQGSNGRPWFITVLEGGVFQIEQVDGQWVSGGLESAVLERAKLLKP